MTDLPTQARVVIIGGGVVGCSVAYHLTRLGWTDVVLLERKALTSGTTWHAAGLIGQLRASANMTRLARYSAELYTGLEAETGIATGFRQGGSISVALTADRLEELKRSAAFRGRSHRGEGAWGGAWEPVEHRVRVRPPVECRSEISKGPPPACASWSRSPTNDRAPSRPPGPALRVVHG